MTKPKGLSTEARNVRTNWRRDGISSALRRRIRNHRTVWRNALAASHIKADCPDPDGPTINADRRCSIPSTKADLPRGRSATKPPAMGPGPTPPQKHTECGGGGEAWERQ